MKALTFLEEEVLRKLLDGKLEWLAGLREQARVMEVRSRELTGVGFFTRFFVPDSAPRLTDKPSFVFGDVSAEVNDLEHGAGFLLFVTDGAIDVLEGYSYDEPWPDSIHTFRVYYLKGSDDGSLSESNGERDEKALMKSVGYRSF
jgi:hypothetical protein